MKRLSQIAVALVLGWFSGLASAEETSDLDISKLRELFRLGDQAFQDGNYEKALESFNGFLKLLPAGKLYDDPRSQATYYIACTYSRLTKAKEAVEHLDKAMDAGFRDFDKIEADKDLDPIRKSPEYAAVMAKYRKLEDDKLQAFNFDVTTIDGQKVAKKDFLGKVLIVDVWGTWCPPCRMEVPHFVELQKKYGKDGLQIIGLNSERARPEAAAEIVRGFMKENNMNYPCALVSDEVLKTIPNFRAFPTTLFIGRDGRVRKMVVGYNDLAALEHAIKPLLAEKPADKKPAEEKAAEKKS
jgi:thiol-disulfide isomerase/thioredoxin